MDDVRAGVDFYTRHDASGESLYELWERGTARGDSTTAAVASEGYRQALVALVQSLLEGVETPWVMSAGCGNALIERRLIANGITVVGFDVNWEAARLAQRAGVISFVADAATWVPARPVFDVFLADGLLSHVWTETGGLVDFISHARAYLRARGHLLIANDIPAGTASPWGSSVWTPGFLDFTPTYVERQLIAAGMKVTRNVVFHYDRPLSGPCQRGIYVAETDGWG